MRNSVDPEANPEKFCSMSGNTTVDMVASEEYKNKLFGVTYLDTLAHQVLSTKRHNHHSLRGL